MWDSELGRLKGVEVSGVSGVADGPGGAGATQFHGAFCADVCSVSEGKGAQEATTAVIDLLAESRWPGPPFENNPACIACTPPL